MKTYCPYTVIRALKFDVSTETFLSIGLYRNDLLQQFLESWYNQTFLGTHCTFGDDRHLTNRMLSMGYATK